MRDGIHRIHCIPRRLIPTQTWTNTETRLTKPACPPVRFAAERLPILGSAGAEEPLANFSFTCRSYQWLGLFYLILASASPTAVPVKCLPVRLSRFIPISLALRFHIVCNFVICRQIHSIIRGVRGVWSHMAPWRPHPRRVGCILYLICNQMLGTCRFQWLVLTLLHVAFYPSAHSALFVLSSLFSTRGEALVPLDHVPFMSSSVWVAAS
ncbi:hypothetical protein GGR53DRAFT_262114 [Hypoxylon sp. FL1150]|nr:hypothetical protein GGR53DRAFT_262114 [Hypoxylon sp. FL1150]